jgi:subtilase family protein
MRGVAVLAVFLSLPIAADSVPTRCETQTLTYTTGVDIRRLGTCRDTGADETLWHLDRLDSIDGHLDGRFERTNANALVYVFDVGVQKDHDEFADGNVIGGIDAVGLSGEGTECPNGDDAVHACIPFPQQALSHSHGTGVASLIGGRHAGVAPGTSIVSVRVSSQPAFASTPTAAGDVSLAELEQKIRDMVGGVDANGNPDPNGKRFLFVVAAGNSAAPTTAGGNRGQCGPNNEVILFPSVLGPSLAGLITVGGITKENEFWSGSCSGDDVELLGPAEGVFPAINTGLKDYRLTLNSGNSWSTPIVSGVAARLAALRVLSCHPER